MRTTELHTIEHYIYDLNMRLDSQRVEFKCIDGYLKMSTRGSDCYDVVLCEIDEALSALCVLSEVFNHIELEGE